MAYRKIKIGNDEFEYSIGSGVKIKGKTIKSFWVRCNDFLGLSNKEYSDKTLARASDDEDSNWRIPIGPQDIKNYLIEKGMASE